MRYRCTTSGSSEVETAASTSWRLPARLIPRPRDIPTGLTILEVGENGMYMNS